MVNRTLSIGYNDDDPASAKARTVRYLPSSNWKIIFNIKEVYKIAEITTGWVKRVFNLNVIIA